MRSKRKRRRPAGTVAPRVESAGGEELNAESRALLRGDDKASRVRPKPGDDASVQDPLQDWPED